MPVSPAFGTVDELEEYIGSEVTDTARATSLLAYASAEIRRQTGQRLDTVAGDIVIFGDSPIDLLFLPERPVTAVTEVLVDAVPVTEFVWTRWGTLAKQPDWSPSWSFTDHIQVTYDHGYDADTDEMQTIKTICLEAAARALTMHREPRFDEYGQVAHESGGFSPAVFLTRDEKLKLFDLGKVPVG